MMYLEQYLEGRPIEDTRKFLQGIYQGSYDAGVYEPHNSIHSWDWYFEKHKAEFKRGLEIGCGLGHGVMMARMNDYNVWGMDFVFIPKAWKKYKVEKYCLAAEAQDLPYKDNTFDLVMIPDVLEHIPEQDVDEVLREMRRVGSKDYYALIDLCYEAKPVNDKLYIHITLENENWWAKRLKKAGFCIRQIERMNTDSGEPRKVGFVLEKYLPTLPWKIEVNTYKVDLKNGQKT